MGQCGVVVVLALLSVVTYGRHMAPFTDPSCLVSKSCSWHWQTTTKNGTQFCETIPHEYAFDVCPNPFDLPDDFGNEDRPKPPDNITVREFNKMFKSETEEMEQYTCLSISTAIDPYSASKVKGNQLSIRGMDGPDLGRFLCFSMNFSSGLQYESVKDRFVTNECFCGLRPERKYQVTVTTMPVDSMDGDHITTKSKDHITAGCSQPDKINDSRCYKNEEALWEPDCILVEQNHTTGFYNLIDFSFNVAPSEYNFDIYRVFISSSTKPGLDSFNVKMSEATVVNKTCSQSDKSMSFVLVSSDTQSWKYFAPGDRLQAMVKAFPTDAVCLDEQNARTNCKTSSPQTFLVLSDPCIGNPCGAHGNCTSNVEEYNCSCAPGFAVFDNTCKVDPCKILDGWDTYVSQCQNGECIYNTDGSDFYCHCNVNFVAHAGRQKCLKNPCAIIPEANTTFCGVHGKCEINDTTDPAGGSCRCYPGYVPATSQMSCTEAEIQLPVVIGVTVSSCLFGVILFSIVFAVYLHFPHTIVRKDGPGTGNTHPAEGYNGLDYIVTRRRVLPIYSADDHPQHLEVVVSFCRFLQRHCQCDVSLMEWEKSIGPTVEMWLTNQIEKADVVLLICSKGTGLKYRAKAQQKRMDSAGVYGDVFIKALFLLEEYFSRDNACDKFVVTYFDYTSEDDIPVPFKRFAKYKLMKSMEDLYLRIHCKGRESPNSRRRAQPLDEPNYPELEMSRWLYEALEAMKRLVKSDKKWYKKPDSKRNTNGKAVFASDNEQPFTDPHRSDADSAYWTGDHDEPRAPRSLFISNDGRSTNGKAVFASGNKQPFIDSSHQSDTDSAYRTGDHDEPRAPGSFFFSDSHSIGQNSDYSDFDESFNQIQSRVPEPPRDDVFPDHDINGLTDPEEGYPRNRNSVGVPWNDIQVGFPQRPYCSVTVESPL